VLKKSDFVTLNPVLMNISIISGSHNPLKYLDVEIGIQHSILVDLRDFQSSQIKNLTKAI
jgi:hypothetical protein